MLQLQNKKSNKGPLWLVEKKYTLGSDAACDIKIAGNCAPHHAEILIDGDRVEVVNLQGSGLAVNGENVVDRCDISAGSVIVVGDAELHILDPKSEKAPLKAPTNEWSLKALNTALEDKHFVLSGSQTFGRSQECDVSLGVVHLSRKHARITVTDRGLRVEDLNSSNGTFINGKKISDATALAGDELAFDTLRFRVIGPVLDQDKTALRGARDGELTTIRPALVVPGAAAAATAKPKPAAAPVAAAPGSEANKAKPKPRPARPGAQVTGSHAPVSAPAAASDEPKSYGVLIVGLLVLIGAGVAWFLVK